MACSVPCGLSLQSTPRSRSRRDAARGPRVSLYTVLYSFPPPQFLDDFWPAATAHPRSDFSQLHWEARQPLGHSLVHLHVSSTALPLRGPPFPERGAVVSLGEAPVPQLRPCPGRQGAAAQRWWALRSPFSARGLFFFFFF